MEAKRRQSDGSLIMGKTNKSSKTSIKEGQSKTNLELAIQVSDRIELETVRLMDCNCEQKRLCGPSKKSFDIEKSAQSSVDKGTNRVFVLANFTLKTFEIGSNVEEPFAVVDASFLLIYHADSLEEITDIAVEHFGNTNGIYNAWPYWREFVQNTIVRMGLPPLTIPVFRIFAPKKAKKARKKITVRKSASARKKATKRGKGRFVDSG